MDASLGEPAVSWEGATAAQLAAACDVPQVHLFHEVTSTMDVAHALGAAGAPSGTLVLADRQRAGRGRGGHTWITAPGTTLGLSLIERPLDASAVGVLSLRLGLHSAAVLARHAEDLQVKWPNDLMRASGKVGGILVEARWRGALPDWVVIGVGVNCAEAPWPGSAALEGGVDRRELLAELVPALRAAAAARGPLTDAELQRWQARDWARGRACTSPARGVVRGITPDGALLVDTPAGPVRCAAGSLVLVQEE